MCGRFDNDYYATDFLSDILSRGHSSRLYQTLVQEREIFSSISSFVMGTVDPGLFVVSGRVREGIDLKAAEKEIDAVLQQVVAEGVTAAELEKVKNQAEASLQFGEVEVLNRAMNLAFASLSGDAGLVNREAQLMERISAADLQRVASSILREENASVLYYHSIK
jgi:zinc protease